MHSIGKTISVTAALVLNAIAPALAHAGNNAPSEVVEYVGERARQAVVAEGRYVDVTYRDASGKTETAEGFVRVMDETELVIYRIGYRKTISRDKIDVLMVGDNQSQLQYAKRVKKKEMTAVAFSKRWAAAF